MKTSRTVSADLKTAVPGCGRWSLNHRFSGVRAGWILAGLCLLTAFPGCPAAIDPPVPTGPVPLIHGSAAATSGNGSKNSPAARLYRVLIVDGQNNHGVWPKTTEIMREMLEDTGLFSVEVARTAPSGIDPEFKPDFPAFDVVVSNYNGADWIDSTQRSFEEFVGNGGGLVVVHAADNAFPDWPAYNQMIGLGGWGGRSEASGPWLYLDENGREVRDTAPGSGGSHGSQHEFLIEARSTGHPVMRGLPVRWRHAQDELYDRLRGPAENIEILATAWADPATGGTGRHEPMVMAVKFGTGRVLHLTLGHADYSMLCSGFAALLQRGAEWVATGEVTQAVPKRFPTEESTARWLPVRAPQKIQLGKTVNPWESGFLVLAGQPDRGELELLKSHGIVHLISLREASELGWDEAAWAKEGGLVFDRFPVQGAAGLTDEVLDQLREKLSAAGSSGKVMLYCGGAVRVGAVWAAWRAIDCEVDTETAVAEGLAMGMQPGAMQRRIREYIQSKLPAGAPGG